MRIGKFLIAHTDLQGCNCAQSQVWAHDDTEAMDVFMSVCPMRLVTVICREGEPESVRELIQ